MRKLVFLVLCLSAFASAGLTLNCNPELSSSISIGNYVVSVVASAPVTGFALALTPNGAFEWDTITEIVADPFSWSYFEQNGVHYWVADYDYLQPNFSGEAASITFSFPESGSHFQLELLDESFSTVESRSFWLLPEPATLLMLALGACCLVKRK